MENKDCIDRVGWRVASGLLCLRVPGQCHYSSTVVKARVLMLLIWEEGKGGGGTSIYLLIQWHRNLRCTACFCLCIVCDSEKHACASRWVHKPPVCDTKSQTVLMQRESKECHTPASHPHSVMHAGKCSRSLLCLPSRKSKMKPNIWSYVQRQPTCSAQRDPDKTLASSCASLSCCSKFHFFFLCLSKDAVTDRWKGRWQ